jgi:AsmA protein
MKKWFKIIASALGIIILLVVLAVVLLVVFVNPNQFKPFVSSEIKKHTGMTVNIAGDLSWTVYPYLGVKAGHIEFNNPPGFSTKLFAELNGITVGVRLLPLMHARIESDGMSLDGLKVTLIKNAAGVTNWQLLQSSSAPTTVAITPEPSSIPAQASQAIVGLAIGGVDMTNATIVWIDEQKKQQITVDKLNVQAQQITLDRPFPVKIQFHFVKKNPEVSGEMQINTKVTLQLNKQSYRLMNTQLTGKIQRNGQAFNFQSKMNIFIDKVLQRIECQHWDGEIANLKWTGKLEVKNIDTQPIIAGHVKTQMFVLQDLLAKLGASTNDLPAAQNMQADFNFTFDTAKNVNSALQNLTLFGLIKSDNLQLQKIKATDLVVQIKLADGFLKLAPISALFYQGNLQSDATINLNSAVPQLALNTKLTNIHIESLLADLSHNQTLTFSGVSDVALQVSTSGLDSHTILNNLNGTSQFKLNNGVLEGVDVSYWVANAQAIAKQKSVESADTHKTPFGVLTGTATIKNGVIINNDLYLDSVRYDTKGQGTIDLNAQQINFVLNTAAKPSAPDEKKDLGNLYKLTIPIRIVGQLNHPKISIDVAQLANQVTSEQINKVKEDISKKIQKKIDEKLPGLGNDLLKNVLGN